MTQEELFLMDDNAAQLAQERAELIGWVLSMVQAAEDFPLEKHTPEAFFELYGKTQERVPESVGVDDVKRAFALYMLTLPEDSAIVIPTEHVLYDDIAYLIKLVWF